MYAKGNTNRCKICNRFASVSGYCKSHTPPSKKKSRRWLGTDKYDDEYAFGKNRLQREEYGARHDQYPILREDYK